MTTFKEALEKSTEYFNGDEIAANVFVTKYALTNPETGDILEPTPDLMHKRLAKEFARIEANYPNSMTEDEIYDLLKGFKKIIPQGSPMAGIGNPYQIMSISNCFVAEIPLDSYGSILYTDQQLAQISKRRGGVGIDLSNIRPKGLKTKNASKTTDGIGLFMERFSNTIREVGQCIAKGQRVLLKRGLVPIEQVRNDGTDEVWTKIGWVKVLDVKNNGTKNVVVLNTKNGYSLKATSNHIILDENEFEKPIGDFGIGERVCLLPGQGNINREYQWLKQPSREMFTHNRTNQEVLLPGQLTPELAYLVGYSYGDGYVEYNNNNQPLLLDLACSNDHPEIKSHIKNALTTCFGSWSERTGDGALTRISLNSIVALALLQDNDLLKQKSADIKVPQIIWSSPIEVQSAFVSGYFDADGYASGKKKGYAFASISKSFLQEIQTILLSNGIVSKIHHESRESKGWNDLYTLCVVGKTSQQELVNKFQASEKIRSSSFVAKRDCIISSRTAKQLDVKSSKYSYCPNNGKVSMSVVHQLIQEGALDISHNSLFLDEIISIHDCETSETFDLVLEKEHLFWCEGFYVHNSGRRGALMQTLSVHHPEIETFVKIKRDLKKVTGANISIRLSDDFLQAVEDGTDYIIQFPVDEPDPTKCLVHEKVSARKLWDEIMQSAWQSAEPGLLFWDTAIRRNPADCYADVGYKTVSTNPCSELLLSELDSCRLLLINLSSYVSDPFLPSAKFDYLSFERDSYKAQRLMDDMVDIELEKVQLIINKIISDPEPDYIKEAELSLWRKIYKAAENGRRTGLGITALGDTLAYLGLRYGSDESIDVAEKIYATLAKASYSASIDMAEERGAFPVYSFEKEKNHEFIHDALQGDSSLHEKWKKFGRRNIANLTTAPAGSVSIEAQTTSGIEPAFMVEYKRRKKIVGSSEDAQVDFVDDMGDKWQEFFVYHHGFKKWMDTTGLTKYEDSPYYKSMSSDVDWEAKVKLQGAAQKYVDHAISCTVNVPAETTVETVKKIYSAGWKAGCKGLTIYRDGCRSGVLVASDDNSANKKEPAFTDKQAPKRPELLPCDIYHMTVKGEKWNAFVGMLDGRPYEIFAGRAEYVSIPRSRKEGTIKKNGKYNVIIGEGENEIVIKDLAHVFENSTESAFTRTISLALRHGTPVQYIVEQLDKGASKENDMFSLSKGLMRVLKSYIKDGTTASAKKCPACGATESLVYQDGCQLCQSCGDSKCG